ncbi:MAG TPA: hydroxypyruvate isomerase, partial [Pseudomonas sp.]|nr:hydroxypyruvate isomerase [Pseudomonas sp.]
MPRFAANLSMLYPEHAFLDRFAAAAADGFQAVEYLFPYEHTAAEIKARLDAAGLTQVLFNAPPGDWAAGERGLAALPGREAECRAGIDRALDYAAVLGNRLVHVMAGLLPTGVDRARARDTYLGNLAHAAEQAAKAGVTILIEPINPRDMPGYFLNRQDDA